MPARRPVHHAGIVVPLRSFTRGKARLAPILDEGERAALARRMAETVVVAAADRPLVVVSSAPEVVAWSATHALACIDDPGTLDAAADAGRAWVAARGLARVVVAHADLPLATTLDEVADVAIDDAQAGRLAVLVADHRGDGTTILSIPVAAPFAFSYGPGSFARHVAEARRAGLDVRVVDDPGLRFDVDLPEDVARLGSTRQLRSTRRLGSTRP